MASAAATAFAEKHNAGLKTETPKAGGNHQLKSYVDRLVALETEKKATSDDIRDVKAEAKEHDFDPRALSVMVKREMEDAEKKAKRVALQETVDAYAAVLGFLD